MNKEKQFEKAKEAADQEQDYQGGGAYRAFLELFYKNKKINFIEFCYAIYSIYNWALAIKLKLNKENAQEYGSMFFNEIIKYKRKNLLRFIFFLIFLRKFFSKDRIFYYNAFIKTLNN